MRLLLESLIRDLGARGLTVATAESCSGGLLAAALTECPGSSQIFVGGVVAYANAAKTRLIGVSASLIEEKGAVSREVALAMAQGVQSALKSDFALSLTGVAGPAGGTAGKPVGTVWCGIATPNLVDAVCWQLAGDRAQIREQSTLRALKWLLESCQK